MPNANATTQTEVTHLNDLASFIGIGMDNKWKQVPSELLRAYTIVALTGTAETLLADHEGCLLTLNNASPITLTIPQDSTLVMPVGARVRIMRLGAGQITVAAGSGATLRTGASFDNLRAQYAIGELIKIAENVWVFTGDTSAT